MKFRNIIKYALFALLTLFSAVSCNEDDELQVMGANDGQVVFQFSKINVFGVDEMEEIATIKVTLEKDGIRMVTPSLKVNGDKDSLYTSTFTLDAGEYNVTNYKAFGANASLLLDRDIDENNSIKVTAGQMSSFDLPVHVKQLYINNTIKNVMIGICTEVFGSDKSRWPTTVKPNESNLLDWPCFEFETDDYGRASALVNIIFGKEFMGMKKLPTGLGSLINSGIILQDFDLEELPDDLADIVTLQKLTIRNTNLKRLPASLKKSRLIDLFIQDCKLEEFPVELCEMEQMRLLHITGNNISKLPLELGKMTNLVQLSIGEKNLTQLPDCFAGMDKLDLLDLNGCSSLSELPASLKDAARLKGIFMEDCNFTSIPSLVLESDKLMEIRLANNKINSVNTAFNPASALIMLQLDGNSITEMPVLPTAKLQWLSLKNCGLNTISGLSAYPNLKQIDLTANLFSTLPENLLAGTKVTKLNLADNANLTSLPSDFGQELIDGKPQYLYYLDIRNCPNLSWSKPAAWGDDVIVKK